MSSASAISLLARPLASWCSTCSSRGVSSSNIFRLARRRATSLGIQRWPAATARRAGMRCSRVAFFSRYPLAPALSDLWISSSPSKVVSIRIRASGKRSRISRVAVIPSLTGMRRSISVRSGRSSWKSSTARAPSAASPITCKSGSVSTSAAKPIRTT